MITAQARESGGCDVLQVRGRDWIGSLCVLCCEGMSKRPNLLFIYTDEQVFKTLEAYGNSQIHMPNLNRLARQSVVFDQAYVVQPICTPSRSTMFTGLYPHANGCVDNGIVLPEEIPCLPEMMPGDYVTAHYGKWHLGDELFAQHGFQQWIGIEDNYNHQFTPGRDRSVRSGYHHFLIENGLTPKKGDRFGREEAARLPEHLSKPKFLAREASRFLRENRDNPFILCVGFLEPHMPYISPRNNQYDPNAIPLPPNFHAIPTESQTLKARVAYEKYRRQGANNGLTLKDEADWRRLIAYYWGLCSLIDTHVGTILDTLEECGLRDNTIVVFTSDHGDMMGAHQLIAKDLMFQESVRVPWLIRLPGQTESIRVTGPVSHIDLVPTLLDLMGHEIPSHLQGKSLRPWIEGPNHHHDAPAFVQWNTRRAPREPLPDWMLEIAPADQIIASITDHVRTVIRPDGWKFNCSPIGEHELYNLNQDPGETENLFGKPEYADIVADSYALIRDWQRRTADTVQLPPISRAEA